MFCLVVLIGKKHAALQKHVYFDWSMNIFDKNAFFLKKVAKTKKNVAFLHPRKLDIDPEGRMRSEIY